MITEDPNETLKKYYACRAGEYEDIYHRENPQRQMELSEIQSRIKVAFRGANVLEVACGTGYWTQFVSETAESIAATDFNEEVLEIARRKQYSCPVSIEKADAYHLPFPPKTFSGGIANFWFSHIPKNLIGHFLEVFHRTLKPGSIVFIADNMNVGGIGGTLITKPGDENTYKLRTLKDGTQHEVLKNYFTAKELLKIFKKYDPGLSENDIYIGECYWFVQYTTEAG